MKNVARKGQKEENIAVTGAATVVTPLQPATPTSERTASLGQISTTNGTIRRMVPITRGRA
ncbi:MAG: hypothetical protein M3R69_08635 [Acidobacteriota bacterium]|nr:hypothetical protein [Acidobacteriota bacterium]